MLQISLLFIMLLALYFLVSVMMGKLVHGLTFLFAKALVVELLLTLGYFYFYGSISYSPLAWRLFLASYFLFFLGLALGYLAIHDKHDNSSALQGFKGDLVLYSRPRALFIIAFFFILAGMMIFLVSQTLHVAPFSRQFYTATRVGFGSEFYVGSLAGCALFIVALFALNRGWLKLVLLVVGLALLFAFGSKGIFLTAFVILFYKHYFARHGIISFSSILASFFAFMALFFFIFWFLSAQTKGITPLFLSIVQYADYVRNFLHQLTVTTPDFNGKLTWENNFFSLIPRDLWLRKPYLFGNLTLSHYFFTFNPNDQQGAPSFGPYGTLLADFGSYALLLLFVQGLLIGWVIRRCEIYLLKVRNHLGVFILMISMMGLYIINPGIDAWTILLINALIGWVLHAFLVSRTAREI